MVRIRRPNPPPARAVIVAALAAVVVGVPAAAATWDLRSSDVFLPRTTVGGVAVGGLHLGEAIQRLREAFEDPLHLPLSVSAAQTTLEVTPWGLGWRVPVEAAARRALAAERDGGPIRRLWRRIAGGGRSFALSPSLNRRTLDAFVERVARMVAVPPRDASLEVTRDGWVRISPSRSGRALDEAEAKRAIVQAVEARATRVTLPVRDLRPAVETSAFDTVVLVRTGENRLYLYEGGVITRSYPVATGHPRFPTPVGTFRIVSKRVNPTWVNPGSEWARSMPKSIPPGPDNPLGSRAMDLNVEGIRIHGTPDVASIGYSVSHGCIRMTMVDAEDLFGRVSVGTPVVVVQAGPPRLPAQAPAA